MIISHSPDIEQVLVEQARKQGTTPELLALGRLREHFMSFPFPQGMTEGEGNLADFLGACIGTAQQQTHPRWRPYVRRPR